MSIPTGRVSLGGGGGRGGDAAPLEEDRHGCLYIFRLEAPDRLNDHGEFKFCLSCSKFDIVLTLEIR